MSEKTQITIKDCLAGAFRALLCGDTDSRDKLCAMAERKFLEQGTNMLSEDTVVTRDNTKDI